MDSGDAKTVLVITIALIVFVVAVWFLWQRNQVSEAPVVQEPVVQPESLGAQLLEQAQESAQTEVPEINPFKQNINPFKNAYRNPFESL